MGIARGGWIPGRILSDLLGNPYTANIKVEFYKDYEKTVEHPVITQPVSTDVKDKKVIIADDVADTGRSLKAAYEHLKEKKAREIRIVTLYYKPWSIVVPDIYVEKTDKWIIFPWEIREATVEIVKRLLGEGKKIGEIKKVLVNAGIKKSLVERFLLEMMK